MGFRKIGSAATALVMLLTSTVARGDHPRNVRELTPLDKWVLNYGDDGCKAAREFRGSDEAIVLLLNRTRPSDGFEITLVGPALRSDRPLIDIPLAFDGSAPVSDVHSYQANSGTMGKRPMVITRARLDNYVAASPDEPEPARLTPAQEAAVTALTFRAPSGRWYRLPTPSMGPLMAAMRKCTDNLLASWGFDPAVQGALRRKAIPIGQPDRWITSSDYPLAMLARGQMALVNFRLDIDERGAVTGCHIISATMPKEASAVTCRKLTERARFDPALGPTGQPVKTTYVSRVRFILP